MEIRGEEGGRVGGGGERERERWRGRREGERDGERESIQIICIYNTMYTYDWCSIQVKLSTYVQLIHVHTNFNGFRLMRLPLLSYIIG